jgi:hypothetical protein
MTFENLRQAKIKDINKRYESYIKDLETEKGRLKIMQWFGKSYKKNPKSKLFTLLYRWQGKEIKTAEEKIKLIEDAKDFGGIFVITVELKKSRMWGSNPRAYTNYNFEGESIGGCGYDKLSTATAQALNSNLSILKLLYTKQDTWLKEHEFTGDNSEALEYGVGYNVLPAFEGGVGVSSHERVIKGLGLSWMNVTSTSNTDVFMITKGEV